MHLSQNVTQESHKTIKIPLNALYEFEFSKYHFIHCISLIIAFSHTQ